MVGWVVGWWGVDGGLVVGWWWVGGGLVVGWWWVVVGTLHVCVRVCMMNMMCALAREHGGGERKTRLRKGRKICVHLMC
jgi:hypothetical protein